MAQLPQTQPGQSPGELPVPQTFHCSLVTPEKQVLQDEVTHASLPLWDGMAGFAPMRAPIVAKLGHGVLKLDFPQGGSRHFYISGGFVQMKDNKLSLMTTEAIPAEKVIKQEVIASLKAAEALVADDTATAERKTSEINRAKSMLHMLEEFDNRI